MDEMVRAELEEIERTALDLGGGPSTPTAAQARAVEQQRTNVLVAASTALNTLLYLGLISRTDDREWRERLGVALGEDIQPRRFHITKAGEDPRDVSPESEAANARFACREERLTLLARVLHTAATKEAITDAFAEDARDPDLVRAACARGFAERDKAA